jgi:putative FmdB family regulatory protein
MPIYEYQCQKCNHHLEALQRISDKPLRECPECGKHTLKRLVSAPMFRLAGSGWYETDFKSDKETRRNLAGKDEAPAESAKESADKKTDAKIEAKGESDKKVMVTKPATKAGSKTRAKPAAKKPAAKKGARKR